MRIKSFTIKQLINFLGEELFYIKGNKVYFTENDEYISRDQLITLARMKKANIELEYAKAHYDELDAEDRSWIDKELELEKELENSLHI